MIELNLLTLRFNGCFGLSLQPLTQSLLSYQPATAHSDCGEIFLLNRVVEEPKRKARHFGCFARSICHPRQITVHTFSLFLAGYLTWFAELLDVTNILFPRCYYTYSTMGSTIFLQSFFLARVKY